MTMKRLTHFCVIEKMKYLLSLKSYVEGRNAHQGKVHINEAKSQRTSSRHSMTFWSWEEHNKPHCSDSEQDTEDLLSTYRNWRASKIPSLLMPEWSPDIRISLLSKENKLDLRKKEHWCKTVGAHVKNSCWWQDS